MRKTVFCFFLLVLVAQAEAQGGRSFQLYSAEGGRFTRQSYDSNIIKIVYTPAGTIHEPNLSDAVILKPASAAVPQKSSTGDHFITLGANRPFVISTHHSDGYTGFLFSLQEGEKIFGGGERALPLNRRGYRLNLYNNPWYGYGEGADNLNYSVPFITSSKGYALFFDNPSKSYIDIGKASADVLEYGASSGELNVYVIFGDYQQILRSYHKLTGRQPLPPRWALGNLMSRFGYTSEANVKEIYAKMKEEQVPVDAIIFDLFWFGDSIKGTLGNLEWMNRTKWPDPRRMIAGFKKDGVQTILVTEPFFVETSKNYAASKPFLAVDSAGRPYRLTDFYFGKGGLIDIFRKDAQQWFWQFYKKQMLNGVEAWWGDLGEPEKHPSNLYHNGKDLGYRRLFNADAVHNIYGHNWTKMLFNNYAKDFPNKRLFSLNRSGFAGSQRYSIFPWTGDVSRSWSGLRAQLPILLGMTMSGVPYVHSDAGGFAGGEGDKELYVRWLQFAAFTPIFRPHGTALYEVEPTAFSFPSEAALVDEPYRSTAKEAIAMRYAFLPYNYSLAYQQAKNGKPLMAPLYYYFPADTNAVKIEDEYMWGEDVLVAPVITKGERSRKYYLPRGDWYNMGRKELLEGGQWLVDSNSLDIPVLIKEGGFVPLLENTEHRNTTHLSTDTMVMVYIVSEKPSVFQLFDDDGKTKGNLESGRYQLVRFASTGKQDNQLTLSVAATGHYPGNPLKRNISFVLPNKEGKPKRILVNKKQLNLDAGLFTEGNDGCICDEGMISFQLNFTGAPVEIKISW